jgi:membrane-anchored mycosin MYCP
MGGARLAVLALAGSLTTAGLAMAPIAAAAPTPTPSHAKTRPTAGTSKKPSASPSAAAPVAPPVPPCKKPLSFPASHIPGVPWAQSRLDFIKAWPISRGKGVTVAVVDSGVNAQHPQLAGRVRSVDLTNTHNTDCLGHGTWVAGIIAASDERNAAHPVPFVGVAPDAHILSIKDQSEDTGGDPALLARGIRLAVQDGADIINVSAVNTDFPALRSAVRFAQQHDVLIVASAGNTDPTKKASEREEYPASYPSVLSVGAVGQSGLTDFSNTTSRVDVSAPGDDIISTSGDGYVGRLQGTSFAAPYVAGIAALIKASKPGITAQQIKNRIIATADGSVGSGSGNGVVNPFLAVTAIGDFNASPTPSNRPVAQPIDIGGPPPIDHRARKIGGLVAAGTLGAALLVVFGGVVAPIGARRGWRPGRAAPIRDNDSEESGD